MKETQSLKSAYNISRTNKLSSFLYNREQTNFLWFLLQVTPWILSHTVKIIRKYFQNLRGMKV